MDIYDEVGFFKHVSINFIVWQCLDLLFRSFVPRILLKCILGLDHIFHDDLFINLFIHNKIFMNEDLFKYTAF